LNISLQKQAARTENNVYDTYKSWRNVTDFWEPDFSVDARFVTKNFTAESVNKKRFRVDMARAANSPVFGPSAIEMSGLPYFPVLDFKNLVQVQP